MARVRIGGRSARRVGRGLVLLGVAALAWAPTMTVAGAQDTLTPITDYDAYPAPLPAGCADGADVVTGLLYSNGRGGQSADLRKLDVQAGDTLTASWDGWADGCATDGGSPLVALTLAAYDSPTPTFSHLEDQYLVGGSVSCGAEAGACATGTGGRQQLSITVPGPTQSELCNTQLELVIGAPLAIVGPSGSFYNSVLRNDDGPDTGIGAKNQAIPNCTPGTTPVSVLVPTTLPPTTAPPATTPPTTTPPATTPPTTAPAQVSPQQVSATTAAPVVQPAAVAATPVSVLGVQVARAQLPATGNPSAAIALAGSVLLVAGGALVLAGRRSGQRLA